MGRGSVIQIQKRGINSSSTLNPLEMCKCCKASRAALPRGVTPTLVDWYIWNSTSAKMASDRERSTSRNL
ncbi:MAG: hypothetical protein EBV29_07205 [Gammaproteobacteria bacterium]|nr:hypothetical protein [Gammaproteobacteria bacterium]